MDYKVLNEKTIMNNELEICGRHLSWPVLRYLPNICLVGLRKITKGT
jgi:hypothetical protein